MIRGQKKPLEDKQTVNVDINTSIHNRFDIEVIDSRTGKVRQRAQAENIILNQLWEYFYSSDKYFSYIHYGSGTVTPEVTDISLTEPIGYAQCNGYWSYTNVGTNRINGIDDNENYWLTTNIDEENKCASARMSIRLDETTAVGKSISEVGIAYSSTENSLCTKALLKDMNGNALIINKTDTDIINIYATIYVHWSNGNGIVFNTDKTDRSDWFLTHFLTGAKNKLSTSTSQPWTGCNDYGTVPNYLKTSSESGEYTEYQEMTIEWDSDKRTLKLLGKRLAVDTNNYVGGISKLELQLKGWYKSAWVSDAPRQGSAIILSTGDNTWYPGSTITGEAIGTGDGSTVDFSSKFRLHKNCKIMVNGSSTNNVTLDIDKDIAADSYNIHFTEPPSEGDVITADYFTDVIAKDENHVFDFSITFHFGEKVS